MKLKYTLEINEHSLPSEIIVFANINGKYKITKYYTFLDKKWITVSDGVEYNEYFKRQKPFIEDITEEEAFLMLL